MEFSITLQPIFKVGKKLLSRLKQPISAVLEVGLENFFDSHV